MNKPDWKDAPEWAQFLAMDADGEWYWYELEPSADESIWWSYGRYDFAGRSPPRWRDTLEARP